MWRPCFRLILSLDSLLSELHQHSLQMSKTSPKRANRLPPSLNTIFAILSCSIFTFVILSMIISLHACPNTTIFLDLFIPNIHQSRFVPRTPYKTCRICPDVITTNHHVCVIIEKNKQQLSTSLHEESMTIASSAR